MNMKYIRTRHVFPQIHAKKATSFVVTVGWAVFFARVLTGRSTAFRFLTFTVRTSLN